MPAAALERQSPSVRVLAESARIYRRRYGLADLPTADERAQQIINDVEREGGDR